MVGKVIHKSDVQTIPNSSYSSGQVLAITSDNFVKLTDIENTGFSVEEQMPQHFQFSISEELFTKFVESSISIGNDGSYSSNLTPGTYTLCLGNLNNPNSQEFPISILGCVDNVQIHSNERLYLDLYFGEGGLTTQ